jgi:divalent metal cation (Fe/Co/Zn/Cd) transporter
LIIVATGGWFWLDPVVALLISSAIGYRAVLLLRDISKALQLARVP